MQIYRYPETTDVTSSLSPLDDMLCWVEGLTSAKYVKDLLLSKHNLTGNLSITERSDYVSKSVGVACQYLEQAQKGPKEVSFLPLYYAILNLLKSYIVIGPYGHQLNSNRWHGASYNPNNNFQSLDDEEITIQKNGAIQLFYHTVVGQSIFNKIKHPLTLKMRDIYPYIVDISAEYAMVTGRNRRLVPFHVNTVENSGKIRIEANCISINEKELSAVPIHTLQAFNGLRREKKGGTKLVSKRYSTNNITFTKRHLRSAMLYTRKVGQLSPPFSYIPSSKAKLYLPEELPILLAFFHMSSIVRYNPDGFKKLMNSEYLPVLLVLRRHGLYRFLTLFWSFINQSCTFITVA